MDSLATLRTEIARMRLKLFADERVARECHAIVYSMQSRQAGKHAQKSWLLTDSGSPATTDVGRIVRMFTACVYLERNVIYCRRTVGFDNNVEHV